MIGFVLPSLVLGFLLAAAVWIFAGQTRNSGVVGWLLAAAFIFGCFIGSKVFVLQVVITGLLWALCNAAGARTWPRRIATVAAAAFAFNIAIGDGIQESRYREEYAAHQREQYPLQSLASRLAYETKAKIGERAPIVLATEVENKLQMDEAGSQITYRTNLLSQLHQAAPAASPARAGFMPAYYGGSSGYGLYALPSPREIPLTEPPPKVGCNHEKKPEYEPTPAAPDSTTPLYALRAFHDAATANFLDPDRFGHVQDRDHVAGFEPHAFQSMPAFNPPQGSGPWKLQHLDLVSVQRPSGPHVYVTAYLPKCDNLKTLDTRLPDDFETRALSRLRTDEDLVIEDSDGVVRMMGALRAGKQCIQCHAVERGEVIGAFSYEIYRETPGAKPQQFAQNDSPPET